MTELEKELKELRQTCLQLAQENAQITSELENVQTSMGKLVEQTLASVALNKFQNEQIEKLKAENAKLTADDMADAYLKAEGEAADASHWGQVAVFIDLVRQMRAAQAEYFRTRDKEVMRKSIALEREVDSEIKSNDNVAWVLQYLK